MADKYHNWTIALFSVGATLLLGALGIIVIIPTYTLTAPSGVVLGLGLFIAAIGVSCFVSMFFVWNAGRNAGKEARDRQERLAPLSELDRQGRMFAEMAIAVSASFEQVKVWAEYEIWRVKVLEELVRVGSIHDARAIYSCSSEKEPPQLGVWGQHHVKEITGTSAVVQRIVERLKDEL